MTPPGDPPHPGIEPHLPCLLHWQADSLLLSHPSGKPVLDLSHMIFFFHCVFSSLMHGFVLFSFEPSLVFSVESLI